MKIRKNFKFEIVKIFGHFGITPIYLHWEAIVLNDTDIPENNNNRKYWEKT